MSLRDRFWARVRRGDGCWEWTGPVMANGYGRVVRTVGGRRHYGAHRVAWGYTRGWSIAGHVRQDCGNRLCCRPDHLRQTGEVASGGALTDDERRDQLIRDLRYCGLVPKEIAHRVGVSMSTVWRVLRDG